MNHVLAIVFTIFLCFKAIQEHFRSNTYAKDLLEANKVHFLAFQNFNVYG